MRKNDELYHSHSCLNKAKFDEWCFVLLGRDVAASETIRFWCDARIRLGKNTRQDPQIEEALAVAQAMEQERQNA